MISPTDTAYPVLSASPSARELMDSFTPNQFELSFAEERTRQAASRVDLLVLLKTFQRLGYFVKLAADRPPLTNGSQPHTMATTLHDWPNHLPLPHRR